MAIDSGSIIIAGIMALSNFGGIAVLAKKYAGSVDDHNKSIPAMLESLKTILATQEQTAKHLDELYNGRNDLVIRVNKVETTHEMRGCNQPINNTRSGDDRRKH